MFGDRHPGHSARPPCSHAHQTTIHFLASVASSGLRELAAKHGGNHLVHVVGTQAQPLPMRANAALAQGPSKYRGQGLEAPMRSPTVEGRAAQVAGRRPRRALGRDAGGLKATVPSRRTARQSGTTMRNAPIVSLWMKSREQRFFEQNGSKAPLKMDQPHPRFGALQSSVGEILGREGPREGGGDWDRRRAVRGV